MELDIDSFNIANKLELGFKMNKLTYIAKNKKEIFPIKRGNILWYGWYEHNKCTENNNEINMEPSIIDIKKSSIFI